MATPERPDPVPNPSSRVVLLIVEAVALILGADTMTGLVVAGLSVSGDEGVQPQGTLLVEDAAAGLTLLALALWRARGVLGADWPGALGLGRSNLAGRRLGLLLAIVLAADLVWSAAVAIVLGPFAAESPAAPALGGSGERLLWLIRTSLVAPIVEEVFFRGYLQARAGLLLPPAAGVVLVALLFAVAHYDGTDLLHPVATLSSGLLWGLVRLKAGSLRPCILLHASFNGLVAGWEIVDP